MLDSEPVAGEAGARSAAAKNFFLVVFSMLIPPFPPRIIIIVMRKMNTKYMKIEIYLRTLYVFCHAALKREIFIFILCILFLLDELN